MDYPFIVMQLLRIVFVMILTGIGFCIMFIFAVKAPGYTCFWVILISILAFFCLWRYAGYQKVYEFRVNLPKNEKYHFEIDDKTLIEYKWIFGVGLYSIGFSLALMTFI